MNPIIEVKNLGKRYNITHQRGGYLTLRDLLARTFLHPLRFLKNKMQGGDPARKEEFWALQDISFNIMRGEIVGIIGANGAGKSTLLKILTGITPPTEGEAILRGRVASLLEVGTGFHPELTGRENIYLNGAILGMGRKEIAQKFDQIVEFAGIEKFLDTPVKRYSSGMYVRLAFSVAAHLEPDILLVDEVLAVGDAEFQKKCLGKMEEVTKKEGRTILFVSHNLSAVENLCQKSIFLEKGKIKAAGPTKEVIATYLSQSQKGPLTYAERTDTHEAHILKISIKDEKGEVSGEIFTDKPFFIEIEYELQEDLPTFAVVILSNPSASNTHVLSSLSNDNNQRVPHGPGNYRATVKIEPILNAGTYSLTIGITTDCKYYLDKVTEHNILTLKHRGEFAFPTATSYRPGSIVAAPLEWHTEKIEG